MNDHDLTNVTVVPTCTHCHQRLGERHVDTLDGMKYCGWRCVDAWLDARVPPHWVNPALTPPPLAPYVPPAKPNTQPRPETIAAYIASVVPEIKSKPADLWPAPRPPQPDKSMPRQAVETAAVFGGFFVWLAIVSLVALILGIPLFL